MAEPSDSAIFLEDVSAIFQTQYMPEFTPQTPGRFGTTTNKLIKPYMQIAATDGITMQFELGPADSVRTDTNPLGDMAAPDVFDSSTIRLRFNRQTPTSNDFTHFTAAVQFDTYSIDNMSKGTIVDACQRVYNAVMADYDEKTANLRNAPRSGQLALVNGTPKKSDNRLYASAGSTPTNTTGMRILIDTGSIAAFRRNLRFDFIRPATGAVVAGNLRCTNHNTAELNAAFEFVTSGPAGKLSTGNIANVADNDIIVYSGTYNKGYYGPGAWFSSPTASESFIGGVDRTTTGYQHLNPVAYNEGGTSSIVKKSHFDGLGVAMGFLSENPQDGLVFLTDPAMHNAIRAELGENSFFQIPEGDTRLERYMNFGSIGLNYQHPTFGLVKFLADPLLPPNTVRAMATETFKCVFVNHKGLKPVINPGGNHWYRLPQATPNTGLGLIYKADWFGDQTDWCMQPWKNGQILNVTAS